MSSRNANSSTTTNNSNTNTMSLNPFDLSGLGMGFGLYRPRRASYTFATQESRQRNESFKYAVRKEGLDSTTSDLCPGDEEYIGDALNHRRKTSYTRATKNSSSRMPVFDNEGREVEDSDVRGVIGGSGGNGGPLSCSCSHDDENTTLRDLDEDVAILTRRDYEERNRRGATNAPPSNINGSSSSRRGRSNRNNLITSGDASSSSVERDDNTYSYHYCGDGMVGNTNYATSNYNTTRSNEAVSLTEVTIVTPLRTTPTPTTTSTTNEFNETPLRGGHRETNGNLGNDCCDHNNSFSSSSVATTMNHHPPPSSSSRTPEHRRRGLSVGASVRKSVSSTLRFNKNLIVLSICFILIYSSFQAIQNLQSSINAKNSLGTVTMMIVHIATMFSCLIAPTVINILSAKWALCLGVLFFLAWFGGNFYPSHFTLIPTSIFIGLAQGVVWSAETSYIHKLAFDWAKISRASLDDEMFRFHGIFLACFQTTHIWGNLISSLWLSQREKHVTEALADMSQIQQMFGGGGGGGGAGGIVDPGGGANVTLDGNTNNNMMGPEVQAYYDDASSMPPLSKCGALFQCEGPSPFLFPGVRGGSSLFSDVLWKLMIFYILFGVIAFLLIIFLLDRIGARASPGKSPKEIATQHISQLVTHPTLRLLIPLLLFNGMQQGFMYSDYNHYFVTCSLGVHYVGYCMITLGVANVFGAVFVTLFAHKIPREVILGFGGILHIALMIGYLIWIPEDKPVLFCVLAGAWGVCDAIWQTQCNTLICLTCVEEPDVAFTNYRLVQSLGLAMMFGMGAMVCVSVKLYILMTLLVLAIMFYVLAEYQLRHSDDEVFEP